MEAHILINVWDWDVEEQTIDREMLLYLQDGLLLLPILHYREVISKYTVRFGSSTGEMFLGTLKIMPANIDKPIFYSSHKMYGVRYSVFE